ncbi:efflux RND transporter permease subunit [Hazenella sp. IB182357]|uniref:Efflux RND transporter permease subunit n=1 Tax=Polycladospora coralii TaxID=2771432 RepID=A0A926N8V4_9BACL|nr:efflux RND transporter permease subunit [Polycladospora coralii]MBD1371502.1 efflux RND transporter permease subunit [Polycladospora coralii]MBS7528968.1 efflux RND transporter permease subunit [Polycladospora coralii]
MNFLTKFSLKNTISILILTLMVLGSGIIATKDIQIETFPDVSFPLLTVKAVYPNASTEEVEEKVTSKLEDVVLNLKEVDTVSSTSSENITFFTVLYPFGQDIDQAKIDLESAVSQVDLPDEVEPEVSTFSFADIPVYQVAFSSGDLTNMQTYIESELIPEIERVDGVSNVKISGTEVSTINVTVDEEKSSSLGISLKTIKETIQQADYKYPIGVLEQKNESVPLQIKGNLADIQKLKEIDIPLSAPGNPVSQPGTPKAVKLSDIAKVEMEKTRPQISRYNGQDSVILEVRKGQDANTVDVVNQVKEVVNAASEDKDYKTFTVIDLGVEVEKSITTLLKEGGFGALFTVIVILIFLRNFRATLIAIISLPVSIFGTIALLNQFDYTLNIMTLGGIAVAVGRIVDDSIVVIENIYRWRQEHPNLPQKELVFKATKEVMGAVASSTIATLIVFLPLAFVNGIIGEFFRPFSLAVVFSITISLFVAIMLIPVLGNTFFKKVKSHEQKGRWTRSYERLLRGAMKRKWIVFTSAIILLIGSVAMIPFIEKSFLPAGPNTKFEVEITLPKETTLEETNNVAKKAEAALQKNKDIQYSQVSIGFEDPSQMPGSGPASTEHVARFFVELQEGVPLDDAMEEIEKEVLSIAQTDYKTASSKAKEVQQEGPPEGNSIDVNLYGQNNEDLLEASSKIEDLFLKDKRLKNVTNDMQEKQTKWVLELNETGKSLGINPFLILQPLNERLQNMDGGTIQLDGDEWDLTIAFDQKITTQKQVEEMKVMTPQGIKNLGDIVDITKKDVPVNIKHKDGKKSAIVSAIIHEGDTSPVTIDLQEKIKGLSIPKDVKIDYAGGMEMMNEGFVDLGYAMLAAILLVFFVLSITFGGLRTPIVILSSLIFVPIGSLAGLMLSGQSLSMSALIGMLMLIGIVVTNAVVLLDRVEDNRREGNELVESIVEASTTRLRPILMTALATIFALTPLAVSDSTSGLISKGLAITVIGGLTTSTLLTLVFVPVLYMVVCKRKKITKEEWAND